jgi:hypothetical protein
VVINEWAVAPLTRLIMTDMTESLEEEHDMLHEAHDPMNCSHSAPLQKRT